MHHTTRRHISGNNLRTYRPTNISCHDRRIMADAVFLIQSDVRIMDADCAWGLLYWCVAPFLGVWDDHDARIVNDL
jgi:hypothetical protein